jgi:hypothetical protein
VLALSSTLLSVIACGDILQGQVTEPPGNLNKNRNELIKNSFKDCTERLNLLESCGKEPVCRKGLKGKESLRVKKGFELVSTQLRLKMIS